MLTEIRIILRAFVRNEKTNDVNNKALKIDISHILTPKGNANHPGNAPTVITAKTHFPQTERRKNMNILLSFKEFIMFFVGIADFKNNYELTIKGTFINCHSEVKIKCLPERK